MEKVRELFRSWEKGESKTQKREKESKKKGTNSPNEEKRKERLGEGGD